jgi:hypothetical protein
MINWLNLVHQNIALISFLVVLRVEKVKRQNLGIKNTSMRGLYLYFDDLLAKSAQSMLTAYKTVGLAIKIVSVARLENSLD